MEFDVIDQRCPLFVNTNCVYKIRVSSPECQCAKDDEVVRKDKGTITNKDAFPLEALSWGGTEKDLEFGKFKMGPLHIHRSGSCTYVEPTFL